MHIYFRIPDDECTTIFQQCSLFLEQFQQTNQELFVMGMAYVGIYTFGN